MVWAILDTNIYIDYWEHGMHQAALSEIRKACIIRQSAVVLSELRRGARTRKAKRLVEDLRRRIKTPWEPSALDWWETGRLLRRLADARGWDPVRIRSFQNDVLIAISARRHGAVVVTADREDFEILSRAVGVQVMFV
jgi:predicted nucleic acid-binding protein